MGTEDPSKDYYSFHKIHNSEGNMMYKNDHNKLTYPEMNTLNDYAGFEHTNLNRHHRENGEPFKEYPHKIKYIENQTKHMDSAIGKHTTEDDAHVWRGVHKGVIDKLKMKPGDTFHDKGYVSTSLNPLEAKSFSYDNHVMHIYLPKGSKALHLPSHGLGNQREDEVILPRNSKFKYNGSEMKGNTTIHHLTHIPEGSEE